MCRNKMNYFVNISMSSNIEATIGFKKLSLGYVKCKLYKLSSNRRCYHCQRHGHLARNCTNPVACSRCTGEHSSKECEVNTVKCVNCVLGSKAVTNHASYSDMCLYIRRLFSAKKFVRCIYFL